MEVGPGGRGDVVVDRLADQGMAKPGPPCVVAAEQVGPMQRLDRLFRLRSRKVSDGGGDRSPEPGAQHTGCPHIPLGSGINGREPGQQPPPRFLRPGRASRRTGLSKARVGQRQLQQQRIAIAGRHRPIGCIAADVTEMIPEHLPGRLIGQRSKPLNVRKTVHGKPLGGV